MYYGRWSIISWKSTSRAKKLPGIWRNQLQAQEGPGDRVDCEGQAVAVDTYFDVYGWDRVAFMKFQDTVLVLMAFVFTTCSSSHYVYGSRRGSARGLLRTTGTRGDKPVEECGGRITPGSSPLMFGIPYHCHDGRCYNCQPSSVDSLIGGPMKQSSLFERMETLC